ncbi:MAG: DUF5050 domain-containing protein [candidate division WOR-3 bacterium]
MVKKGNYARAIRELNVLIKTDSLNHLLHYNLALAYASLDSLRKASQHFVKLVEMNSELKDSMVLKLKILNLLQMEPYPSSPIPMGKMNQFKGSPGPDNELIAVAAAKLDRADIYLVKLDGTIVKKITQAGMNTDPALSPLGDKIAFVSDSDGDEEIFLYDIKKDSTIKLTNNNNTDFSPSFSPDGKEIVYVSDRDKNWEIYKINLEKKFALRLTNNKFWDGFPSYTPDGKFIVFSSRRNGSDDIYLMKSDGSAEQLLYATGFDETDPHLAGDNLIFRSNKDGEFEIYQYNIKTKNLLRLTYNNLPDWNPRVTHDGKKILVSRKIKNYWQLFFINLEAIIPAEVIAQKIYTEGILP